MTNLDCLPGRIKNYLGSGLGMFLRMFLEWINWVRKISPQNSWDKVSIGPQKRLFTSPFSHFLSGSVHPCLLLSFSTDLWLWPQLSPINNIPAIHEISSRTSVNYLDPQASAIVDQVFTGLLVCLVYRHALLTYFSTILLSVQWITTTHGLPAQFFWKNLLRV